MIHLTKRFKTRKFLVATGFIGICACQAALADTDIPFEAVYEVTINGKPRLETRVSLSRQGEAWVLESSSKGTRGMAKFLNVRSNESSTGRWENKRFVPNEFRFHSRLAGHNERWSASFDWTTNMVTTEHEDGESILAVTNRASDPLSVTLFTRNLLEQGVQKFTLEMVDEDVIDHHDYLAGPVEQLHTPLGCFEVTPVKRIRINSKRYTQAWYAKSLAFIPLQIRHGKKGGKEYKMRITSLIMDGKEISGTADCPS